MEDESKKSARKDWKLKTEKYSIQKDLWPASGKHILAQYNDEAILVYQAYNNQIADYAIENQKFGGPHWSSTRMTWIKTSFLWMMFRSGWGEKSNQERILGIWLKRSSFERYIAMASKDHPQKGTVRLQWDPDHYPDGERHHLRRAIQLGLKNVQTFINGGDIVLIQDVTDFVRSQYPVMKSKNFDALITPEEKVYPYGIREGESPLRVTFSLKGKQKVVVLQERSIAEVRDLVNRKFKMTPTTITLPSGEELNAKNLVDLPNGTVLTLT